MKIVHTSLEKRTFIQVWKVEWLDMLRIPRLNAACEVHLWCLLRKSKVICTNWKNFKCIALRVLEKFYLHFYGVLLVVQQHNLLNNLLFIVTVSYRQKQTEVSRLEEQIRVKAEEQRRAGQSLDSTCQICLKTKFADGVGHTCNYCNVRCCARCGGKVALRSSKVSDTPTP